MKRREVIRQSVAAIVPAALIVRPSDATGILAAAGAARQDPAPVPDGRLTAPLPVPASGDINVAVLIGPDAEVVDYAGPWGVFEYVYVGTAPLRRRSFKLFTVADTRDPVRTSSGLTVMPKYTYTDAPAPNVVVVPAMNFNQLSTDGFAWLRAMQKRVDVMMSVCNGAFVLARAGLLDGRSATAHHGAYANFEKLFPAVKLRRGLRFVEDGNVATSGGLTSGMDLAMRVVERYHGREVAKQTATSLEYQGTGWMYPSSNAQFAQ